MWLLMPCGSHWYWLKEAASRTGYMEETLREHCRRGLVHAHRVAGGHGPWKVEVTAQGFPAEAPSRCSCVTPQLGLEDSSEAG